MFNIFLSGNNVDIRDILRVVQKVVVMAFLFQSKNNLYQLIWVDENNKEKILAINCSQMLAHLQYIYIYDSRKWLYN